MSSRSIDVLFFGLLMDADALRAKGLQPIDPRRVCVPGFALRIGRRATLVPDPGSRVDGILMQLTHEEIERLYAEPGVRMYRPEAVIAEFDDAVRIPALCLNLPELPQPDETNEVYAQKLRDLARRLGLPAGYVDDIE